MFRHDPLAHCHRHRRERRAVAAATRGHGLRERPHEVFVDARHLGLDVTYLRYGAEGHFVAQVPNQVDFWNRVFEFLRAHLM
jgi:hypothetical protein